MTEQQREQDLLADLLDVSAGAGGVGAASNGSTAAPARHAAEARQPVLTRGQERALLDAANQAGTPTLAPQERAGERADGSFAGEVGDFVRRYPLPSLLAGAALAFLLTRRRR